MVGKHVGIMDAQERVFHLEATLFYRRLGSISSDHLGDTHLLCRLMIADSLSCF